jgi:hypothetical protein
MSPRAAKARWSSSGESWEAKRPAHGAKVAGKEAAVYRQAGPSETRCSGTPVGITVR